MVASFLVLFGAGAVTGRNSIFWDFLGGTKLNVESLSLGAVSHSRQHHDEPGRLGIRFEVTMNFPGDGLCPAGSRFASRPPRCGRRGHRRGRRRWRRGRR